MKEREGDLPLAENDTASNLAADEKMCEKENTVCENFAQKSPKSFKERFWATLPVVAIYARYLLPAIMGLVSLVLGCLYLVRVAQSGARAEVSLVRLYLNTFVGAHNYLGGTTNETANWFYGLLVTGAIVGIVLYLLAMGLAIFVAVAAVRAFRAGHESEESNRMKLLFKIVFPNRICLFLSHLLLLVPLLFPEYFSCIGKHFLLIGGESVIYVMLNRPLIVAAVMLVLILALAVGINPYERRKKMNMFLLWHPDEIGDGDAAEEDEP
ncbi:MAG: hypothetical protein IJY50_03275 [Clostridia bacterium]|nr:hypothetical protein [Clostridia bacterium]